jgi:DNA-binding MarR family transcriptional regulator
LKRHGTNFAPDDDIFGLAERMRQVLGDFVRAARAQADTPSTARAETLGLLDREGAMSTAALAERRSVKHQSMRLVVAQLKADGLIGQTAAPHDRRSQLVTLTTRGHAALIKDRRARAEWLAAALRNQVTPQEHQTLDAAVSILRRIAMASWCEGSEDN